MLNYNGSSVEQYITLTLISNELIVRNVITENTTGISKALGITTLIMPRLESCHPDLCLKSPAAAVGSAFSRAVRRRTLRIPNLEKNRTKRPTILYEDIQQQAQMATQWHISCLTDTTKLPACIVLPTDTLETRGNGN